MRKNVIIVLVFLMGLLFVGCNNAAETLDGKRTTNIKIPRELRKIPDEYFKMSKQPGTLVDLYYNTYESFSYFKKSKLLKKHAIVYLPYGYNKNRKYDVFYLMHGGWGDETSMLGTPNSPSLLKNVIDNAIAAGELKPLIIVCPTYNNTNENGLDSSNFSLAMQLTKITITNY